MKHWSRTFRLCRWVIMAATKYCHMTSQRLVITIFPLNEDPASRVAVPPLSSSLLSSCFIFPSPYFSIPGEITDRALRILKLPRGGTPAIMVNGSQDGERPSSFVMATPSPDNNGTYRRFPAPHPTLIIDGYYYQIILSATSSGVDPRRARQSSSERERVLCRNHPWAEGT